MLQLEGRTLIDAKSGKHYRNPLCHEAKNAVDEVRKLSAELGLSPTSRTRLVAAKGDKPSQVPPGVPPRLRGA